MDTQVEPQFKTPTTVEEIGVHMFYLRTAVQRVDKKIDEISTGFVTRKDFEDHLKDDEDHETRIRSLKSFQDNLSGRIWAISSCVGGGASILGIIISHYWK